VCTLQPSVAGALSPTQTGNKEFLYLYSQKLGLDIVMDEIRYHIDTFETILFNDTLIYHPKERYYVYMQSKLNLDVIFEQN
jgi:hypothetical protein